MLDESRQALSALIEQYAGQHPEEAVTCERLLQFVRSHPDCFSRSCVPGHVTSSAWLFDTTGKRVLLTHHKKLDIWVQLGGHMEGEARVLDSALREAREESGIDGIRVCSEALFDIDIHEIPARGEDPAHLHYDCRFALQTETTDAFELTDESHELRWVAVHKVRGLTDEESVLRMVQKSPGVALA